MRPRPPHTIRVVALLAGVATLRLWRAMRIAKAVRLQRSAAAGRRRPSRRKAGNGLMVLMVLMLPFMAMTAMHLTARAVNAFGASGIVPGGPDTMVVTELAYAHIKHTSRDDQGALASLQRILDRSKYRATGHGAEAMVRHYTRRGIDGFAAVDLDEFELLAGDWLWRQPPARAALVRSAGLVLLLLGLALLCTQLSANVGDVGREQWSLAWLLTFPVPARAIVLAKAGEYGLVQVFPWFTAFPLVWQVGIAAGMGWWAPVLALVGTAAMTLTIGALRIMLETRLRLRLRLHRVRQVQGACTLGGLLLLAGAMVPCFGEVVPSWFPAVAAAMPGWAVCLPFAWPVAAVDRLPVLAAGVAWTAALVAFGVTAAASELRHGSVRSGGVDRAPTRSPDAAGAAPRRSWAGRMGIRGKDLSLLRRDWAFLTQTLLVPLLLVGLQLVGMGGNVRATPSPLVLSWFVGSVALTGGCFQVLSGEGRALWLLYSLPIGLERALRQKLQLWAFVGIAYALAAFVVVGGRPSPELLVLVIGLWACAHLAAATAALGTDPAADHVPRQLKVRYVYLYLALTTSFVPALIADDWGRRLAAVVVFGTLAFAMWQRVRDRLPFLLDPVAEPVPSIGVFDAGVAMTTYFVLQVGALWLVLRHADADDTAAAMRGVFAATALAGAITVVLFGAVFVLRGVRVGRELLLSSAAPVRPLRALGLGAVAGAALGLVGLGYRSLLAAKGSLVVPSFEAGVGAWLLLLAVAAAPVVEEVLFRGLLFRALARTVPVGIAALWSAVLFMAVHPRDSWPPVFLLGLVAALVLQRTRYLPAAMAAHAVYNAVIVGTTLR